MIINSDIAFFAAISICAANVAMASSGLAPSVAWLNWAGAVFSGLIALRIPRE